MAKNRGELQKMTPVGGSVGGCGARAVSRKTPIYFISITLRSIVLLAMFPPLFAVDDM